MGLLERFQAWWEACEGGAYLAGDDAPDLVVSVPHGRPGLAVAGDACLGHDVGACLQGGMPGIRHSQIHL